DLNISHVLPHSSRIPLWDVTVQIVRWAPLHRLLVDHQLLGSTRFNCSLADASTVRTSVLPPAIRRGWQPMLGHPGSAEANGRWPAIPSGCVSRPASAGGIYGGCGCGRPLVTASRAWRTI